MTDANGKFRTALSSYVPGAKVVTASAMGTQVTGNVTFTVPPCTPLLPGLPGEMLAKLPEAHVVVDLDASAASLAVAATTTCASERALKALIASTPIIKLRQVISLPRFGWTKGHGSALKLVPFHSNLIFPSLIFIAPIRLFSLLPNVVVEI
jgi:hypothetical protein